MPDPDVTQRFLSRFPGVVEAHVWLKNGALVSRAVVEDHSGLTGADLQFACAHKLNEDQVPRLILVEMAHRLTLAA